MVNVLAHCDRFGISDLGSPHIYQNLLLFFFSFRTRTASKASNVYETIVKQAIPMLTASMGIVQYLLFFLPNFQPRVA